jgi:hypothetical protein
MTERRPFLRRGPSGPLATGVGAEIQVGYDAAREELVLSGTGEPQFLPRDGVGTPLEVIFPSFATGNTLECDLRLGALGDSEASMQLIAAIVVSVDGGTTWYTLMPAVSQVTQPDPGNGFDLSPLGAVKIEDPMPVNVGGSPTTVPVTAAPRVRVQVTINNGTSLLVNGAGSDELTLPGANLRCAEVASDGVFQGPFGQLATGA